MYATQITNPKLQIPNKFQFSNSKVYTKLLKADYV